MGDEREPGTAPPAALPADATSLLMSLPADCGMRTCRRCKLQSAPSLQPCCRRESVALLPCYSRARGRAIRVGFILHFQTVPVLESSSHWVRHRTSVAYFFTTHSSPHTTTMVTGKAMMMMLSWRDAVAFSSAAATARVFRCQRGPAPRRSVRYSLSSSLSSRRVAVSRATPSSSSVEEDEELAGTGGGGGARESSAGARVGPLPLLDPTKTYAHVSPGVCDACADGAEARRAWVGCRVLGFGVGRGRRQPRRVVQCERPTTNSQHVITSKTAVGVVIKSR